MRLDKYLCENGFYSSRTKAVEGIMLAEVTVNGKVVQKSSYEVTEGDIVEILVLQEKFVSNGGYKLDKARIDFSLDFNDKVFIDIGASTGGFTDCLLKNGAKKVYCVDVGEDLLDKSIRNDDRVVVMDKTNAKDLKKEDFLDVDSIVMDCSFISARQILVIISNLLLLNQEAIILIKPQFEMDERKKFKNGIIKDKKLHFLACKNVIEFAKIFDLFAIDITTAPIKEGKNVEFLLRLVKNGKVMLTEEKIKRVTGCK